MLATVQPCYYPTVLSAGHLITWKLLYISRAEQKAGLRQSDSESRTDHPGLLSSGMIGMPYRNHTDLLSAHQDEDPVPQNTHTYKTSSCLLLQSTMPKMYFKTPVLYTLGVHFLHVFIPQCGSGPQANPHQGTVHHTASKPTILPPDEHTQNLTQCNKASSNQMKGLLLAAVMIRSTSAFSPHTTGMEITLSCLLKSNCH